LYFTALQNVQKKIMYKESETETPYFVKATHAAKNEKQKKQNRRYKGLAV